MIDLAAERVAAAAGGTLLAGDPERRGPKRAVIDSRAVEPGDVVVIAGKGHEQGQEFENGRKEPFDDVTVAREALRARLGARA